MSTHLRHGQGILEAVPSIHNRYQFAEEVHRLCHQPHTRPEVVAVELGAGAVEALVAWFRVLRVAERPCFPLPRMLGLARRNRLVHPRHRAMAFRLQQLFGKPLHKLPPEVLAEQLDFAVSSLLCLNPTDSIIEAVRSAVELGIPVVGVDVEECASGKRQHRLVEDPLGSSQTAVDWITRNAVHAASGKDPWVDERREQVMSSHLRFLLRSHGRVLFVCGLGHWDSLRAQLGSGQGNVAPSLPVGDASEYERLVVEPAMAASHMDMFPDFAERYEILRGLPPEDPRRRRMPLGVFQDKLELAFGCAREDERGQVSQFSEYLVGLSLLSLSPLPSFDQMVQAAHDMVSVNYAQRLARRLLDAAAPWIGPDQMPELPRLLASPTLPDEGASAGGLAKVEWLRGGRRSQAFYISRPHSSGQGGCSMYFPSEKEDALPEEGEARRSIAQWVWPPCESLFFGTCYVAAALANDEVGRAKAEPFAGSLLDGIDVRASLRVRAQGDRRLRVRYRPARDAKAEELMLTDPVVYLFEEPPTRAEGSWLLLRAGSDLARHVRDQDSYRRVTEARGDCFVSSVQLSRYVPIPAHLRHHVCELRQLYGAVAFGNPCINARQGARWLEENDYRCCPILPYGGISALAKYYSGHHGMTLDLEDWRASLVRIGLPYAKHRVVVVAPDGWSLPVQVRREAELRRVGLSVVPMSSFSRERLEAIRMQYLVHTLDETGSKFPERLAALLGERPDAHFSELPASIRAQVGGVLDERNGL